MDEEIYDVVIIGAGIAGLTAATQLLNLGVKKVLILEAQHYIGGRIKTFHEWGRPIELGAEFVHGDHTITARLAQELGLEFISAYEDRKLVDETGKVLDPTLKQIYYDLMDYTVAHGKHGVSIHDVIENNPVTKDITIRQLIHIFFADLEGGDSDKIDSGVIHDVFEFDKYKGSNLMLKDGYQEIVKYFSEGVSVQTNSAVQEIDYSDTSAIDITLQGGEKILAKKVIITVSLGVLQANGIKFFPALPLEKQIAIEKLGMGQSMKFILRFKEPHEVKDLFSYADGANGSLQTITNWWSSATDPRVLVGYCGGTRASAVLSLGDKRLKEKVLEDLSKILGRNIKNDIVDYMISRWDDNPYTCGSYSYYPVGSGNKERESLASPISNMLFWAGEATSFDGNYATVHGAIGSGYRVAEEVLLTLS